VQEETTAEKKQKLSDARRTSEIVQGSEEEVNAFLEEDKDADVLNYYDDMFWEFYITLSHKFLMFNQRFLNWDARW